MNKITVVCSCYKPNTAPTNRYLSFFKGFEELGIGVDVVYVYPNANRDRIDNAEFHRLSFKYLWDRHKTSNKIIKYAQSFWDIYRYSRLISQNSTVIVLGASEYIPIILTRKDLRVYEERSEHYDVVSLRPRFLQKLYLKCLPKLSGMFVISSALRKAFMDAGANNVSIVNMTVDNGRFKGIIKHSNIESYLAYCGTASNNKDGVDELIKSFAIVHERFPNLKLYIIGSAPSKDDESGNLQLVDNLGLNNVVVFTGLVPAEKIPQVLKNAKVLLLDRPDSIQARNGFPTKLGEYLLTENPVVVTGVGDIPLFLENGVSALIAKERNASDFSSKIIWCIENPEAAAIIGKNGAKVAHQSFNYLIETKKIASIVLAKEP